MVTRQSRAPRRGFTLVELLVVIAIIAILASLAVGATIYFLNTGTDINVQNTLRKLDTGLMQEWKAVKDTAEDEWRTGTTTSLQGNTRAGVMQAVNGDPTKAQQLWIALRLAQEFPVSYQEAQTSTPTISGLSLPAKQAYKNQFANNVAGPEESSACLLAALTVARRGVVFHAEDAVGVNAIRTQTVPKSGGGTTQVQVLIDIYQTPLGFTRGGTPAAAPFAWQPDIQSAGRDQKCNTGDDVSSARLRQTGQRGD
jgi:prepilin-type N-terminal cleavage/methylation domain-containing protein